MFLDVVRVRLLSFAIFAGALSAACTGDRARPNQAAASVALEATDDAAHTIRLTQPATRIVSLVPSGTETILALGARERIVGRTRYDLASAIANVPSIGGGLDPSIEQIVALRPDLVVAWDNDKRDGLRARLGVAGIPVYSLRTQDTTDVFRGVTNLGRLLGLDSAARAVNDSVRAQLDAVRREVSGLPVPSVLFVVYHDPPMTAGSNTFVGELISLAGGRSVFADVAQLWPTISMEEIVRRSPDLLIVPRGESAESRSDAISMFRSLPGWRDLAAVQAGRVVSVPADLVNRPGPALGGAARILAAAMHPELAKR